MKINVNYYYNQKFLPTKRHKNIRERQVLDVISLDITEVTESIFPVAFIVHDMKSVQEGMASYDDYESEKCIYRMFEEKIRTYNGKLYTPIRITHGAAISTIFENKSYVIRQLERTTKRSLYYDCDDKFSEDSIIIEDNKKEICQMLCESVKEYIYFEGKFWHACGEPVYVINTFGLGGNHGGTGFFIEYAYNSNLDNINYFNALQRDEAIAYGKSIALGRGDSESLNIIGKYDNIEVIMPEMVKLKFKKDYS